MAAAKKKNNKYDMTTPQWHETAKEIQKFGTVVQDLPLGLGAKVRNESCRQLNQLLADSITLRDMYKKHHWQVGGPTFYQLHLLFDKHFGEQVELVDEIAERIQLLGGVTIAMGADVAELTKIPRAPKGKEEVPAQISRLLQAHKIVIDECHEIGKKADDSGDDGTNDLVISSILRTNELQAWFIMQHLVQMPLTRAE
jgi:starvation-inducible DNA-binding protein